MMVRILIGDAIKKLRELPDNSIHMCVTSPPYFGLRDYGTGTWEGGDEGCDHTGVARRCDKPGRNDKQSTSKGTSSDRVSWNCLNCGARRIDEQIGLEATPDLWAARMVEVFREVRRVLRPDGVCFVNVGDSYCATQGGRQAAIGELPKDGKARQNRREPKHRTDVDVDGWGKRQNGSSVVAPAGCGLKPKDLIGQPWLLAFALRADGWWLRSEIIWAKPNPMPESVTDRPTKAHEQVFLLTKSSRYFWDAEAVKETGSGLSGGGSTTRANSGDSLFRTSFGLVNGAGRDGTRNMRSVWTIATQPFSESHFATFPEELVRRCILAGTSAKGCCPQCGAPWARVVERSIVNREGWGGPSNPLHGTPNGTHGPSQRGEGRCGDPVVSTTGWRPSCDCVELRCSTCRIVLDTWHDNKPSSTTDRVSDMRSDVPPLQETGAVLLQGVLSPAPEETDADILRPMRSDVPAAEQQAEMLCETVRSTLVSGEPINDSWLDDCQLRVQVHPNTDAPSGHQVRLRDGASACDGEGSRTTSGAERGCSPQERGQARQSAKQSGTYDQASSRRRAKAGLSRDLPALPKDVPSEGQCPHCGSRLERATPDSVPTTVLDCFGGSGTTGLVADQLGRDAVLIELNPEYAAMAERRIANAKARRMLGDCEKVAVIPGQASLFDIAP